MKKSLATLLIAGATLINSYAGPKELHEELGKSELTYKELGSTEGYLVRARCLGKDLLTEIKDPTCKLIFEDKNSDGLGSGDKLYFQNTFSNGETFFFNFEYLEKDKYLLKGHFEKINGEKYGESKVDTSKKGVRFFNFISFGYVEKKLNPVINWTASIYTDLIEAVEQNKCTDLPYNDVKTTIAKLEPKLKDIKSGKLKSRKAILSLNKDFLRIMNEEKEKTKAEEKPAVASTEKTKLSS